MVMIEAMACGTPVIAYAGGSVTEVIDRGTTGFIVNGIEEAVQALHNIHLIDRTECRTVFEQCFSAERMAQDYIDIYNKVIAYQKVWMASSK